MHRGQHDLSDRLSNDLPVEALAVFKQDEARRRPKNLHAIQRDAIGVNDRHTRHGKQRRIGAKISFAVLSLSTLVTRTLTG
jgi:hypothetical protein